MVVSSRQDNTYLPFIGAQAGSYANIGRSLADSPRWMLEIHRGVSLQLQGGSYLNASIRCQLGKKDTPEHFENKPYWYYNQAMDNASRWPVVLSDVTTRQHWLVDGATTILQICQATLCSEDIRYTKKIVGDTLLRYSSGNGSPADSYGVLIDLGNRAERVDGSGRVTALDSPSVDLLHRGVPTFENIATAAYFRLEQLLDARHPAQSRENINIRFKQREFEGFEFNDLVEGQHRAEPKAISLYEEATEWYRFTKKIGTINLFGAGFGPLIMPMAAIDQVPAGGRGTHQMAVGSDHLLGTTLAVLKNTVRNIKGHSKRLIKLAPGCYWTDPESCLSPCRCGLTPARHCPRLISKLTRTDPGSRDVERWRTHPVFESHARAGVIFGRHRKQNGSRPPDIHHEPPLGTNVCSTSSSESAGALLIPTSSNIAELSSMTSVTQDHSQSSSSAHERVLKA